MKDKILVHICCGVDAVWALRKLRTEYPDAEIKGFFYDPNIHPEEEYELRWIETLRICEDLGIECIKGEYDLERWINATKGLENEPERGERCTVCHDLRLEETAKLAKKLNFNKFTTVLLMSPKKDFQVLKKVGESVGERYGLEFLAVDFRKKGGVEKMNRLSKEYQLYHQNYCGCMYALFQQRKEKDYIQELVSFGKGRVAGSREELLFIKKIRIFCEKLGLKVTEQRFRFIGWKLVRSVLMINKEPVSHSVLPYSTSLRGVLRAKIEKIIEEEDRKVLKLNKGNVQIWITGNPEVESLKKPRLITDPVFITEHKIPENSKIELQLESKFTPDSESQNLIIGSLDAGEKIELHSDTLPDGRLGIDEQKVKELIKANRKNILAGLVSIIIYGAEHLGRLGREYFKTEENCLKKL
ncbi:epoxyqueuosine reductase QueH [Persephonella sp.]